MSAVGALKGFWRRRKVRLTVIWTAAAVIVAGGFFWLSGGYDAWRNDMALDTVCDGDLAADRVRALFPDIELESSDSAQEDRTYCYVDAADEDGTAELTLSFRPVTDSATVFGPGEWSAPFGGGWTGSFSFDPDSRGNDREEARASLLLDCGKQPDDGLMATVNARLGRGTFEDPAARTRLTAVLTETATAYARRTGCETWPGKPVKDVGVSTTTWDYKPVSAASGTCAGVLDPTAARRWGVRTAVETAAAPAPIESCTLGGYQAVPLYEFSARYGPFGIRASRESDYDERGNGDSPSGAYSLIAECPGGQSTGAYQVRTLPKGDRSRFGAMTLDHKGLRAALQRFADRSAARHGCEKPQA
ncbi:hypothetical protein [Streptomyces sp. NPDC020681]|uniref:hypothetical protein n=1 Tax=Streptomyces sp. NPDC020681 TaxID=3365083 RepID=UPI00379077BA